VREAKAIVAELKKYDPTLYRKPRWLVLNKVDLLPADERTATVQKLLRRLGWKRKTFIISALTGEGCTELTYAVMAYLDEQRDRSAADDSQEDRALQAEPESGGKQ
jgi:Predicted GTPase